MDDGWGIDELLESPRMFRMLRSLVDAAPVNMRQFTEASLHSRPHAQALRERMELLGYITVKELSGHGNMGVLEIRLTNFGRQVALQLLEIEEIITEHRMAQPLPRTPDAPSR